MYSQLTNCCDVTLYRKEYNNSTWNWTYIHNIVKIKYISIIYFYLYSHSIKNWWLNNNLQKEKLTFFLSKLSQTTIKRIHRDATIIYKKKNHFLPSSNLSKPSPTTSNSTTNRNDRQSTKKKSILSPLQIEPPSISNFQPSQTL